MGERRSSGLPSRDGHAWWPRIILITHDSSRNRGTHYIEANIEPEGGVNQTEWFNAVMRALVWVWSEFAQVRPRARPSRTGRWARIDSGCGKSWSRNSSQFWRTRGDPNKLGFYRSAQVYFRRAIFCDVNDY